LQTGKCCDASTNLYGMDQQQVAKLAGNQGGTGPAALPAITLSVPGEPSN
jgi:hypothetical protein